MGNKKLTIDENGRLWAVPDDGSGGVEIPTGTDKQVLGYVGGVATPITLIGVTATTAKAGNYTPSATEIVTAIEAMTPAQVTAVQTKLGITPTP